ncbi:SH3 domain-containing protein [Thiorhodovibrio winogradskyi]|uniref:SH3 domain-containing protein n=1 Tax=Thiorhodovibrio winogradskyi TaxID=77007 RepID=A0ABZ0S468_9GAMM|nr:TIGR04211 family SH3 domain-containing protein [Thiorhodovibrio winogradskyi]
MLTRVQIINHESRRPRRTLRPYQALLAAVLLAATLIAAAETAYITDEGEFNLRAGESTGHKIVRILPSGTQVDVLNRDQKTGYSRVRTQDGTMGFVLTRYLQDNPAARSELAEMRETLEQLQQEPNQLAAQLSQTKEAHESLKQEHEVISQRNFELEERLAELEHTSANIVRINEERNQLQEDVAKLTRTVGELEQENLNLRSGDDRRWFLTGAGVAGGGLLLGLLLAGVGFGRRRGSRDLF